MSKMYGSILNSRLITYLENNEIIVDEQNGFRRNRSCVDHVFVLNSILKNRLNQSLHTFAAFLDLKKAFDSIQRDLLLYKLKNIGIDGKMYFSVKALYKQTKACVRLNYEYTEMFDTLSGVRQGDTLSATLFSIFINDLYLQLDQLKSGLFINDRHIPMLLYADDIVVLAETPLKLQYMLDETFIWCSKWLLNVNEKKSQIMHIRKPRVKRSNFEFKIGNKKLEYITVYKYLGVYFTENLLFSVHKEKVSAAGKRALGSIISKYKNNKDMTFPVYTKLFTSCVTPILDYCSEVWGMYNCAEIDKVQHIAERTFLGVNKFTPILGIIGDIGWNSSTTRINISMLKYWNRLIQKNDMTLCKHIFLWDCQLNYDNWSCYMRKLFDDCNTNCYKSVSICDISYCLERLQRLENIEWCEKLNYKPKLRTYRQLKNSIYTEHYVKMNLSSKERSMMAQIRMGVLPLHLETGRYRNTPAHQRFCFNCINIIEDECHFIFHCPLYNEFRSQLMAYVYNNGSVMSASDEENMKMLCLIYPRQFAKFVCSAFDKRRTVLYM